MSMQQISRKTLAVVLSLAMLMSCMVFSFSSTAEMVEMWENDFETITDTNWHSALKGEAEGGLWNSGTILNGMYNGSNYAVYTEDADGNGAMALGYKDGGGANGRKYLSGFTVLHQTATTDANAGSYSGANRAIGHFRPNVGKYIVEFDYMLKSFIDWGDPRVELCVGYANATNFQWDSDRDIATYTATTGSYPAAGTYEVVLNFGRNDVDATVWRKALVYLDIPTANNTLHIFLKNGNLDDYLTGTEVLVDNIKVTKYDGANDLPADPESVALKMWENHFDNPGDNWYQRYQTVDYRSDATATGGNFADYTDNMMKLGFTTEGAESNLSGFTVLHQTATHSTAGQYGYKGEYVYSANKYGSFGPEGGKKYAVTLKYNVESFNAESVSSVDICVGYACELYWETAKTLSGFTSTKKGAYETLATVTSVDIAKGWQSGAVYLDVDTSRYTGQYDGSNLYVFAKVRDNVASDQTEAIVFIDDVVVYEYDEADLPVVTFYYEGNKVGTSAPGLPGAPLTVPTLEGVPLNMELHFYSDAALTKRITSIGTYPNASYDAYIKAVAVGDTQVLEIPDGKQAVYTCRITDAGSVSMIQGGTSTELFSIADGKLRMADRQTQGTYGAGTYTVRIYINPLQKIITVEVTLPDGGIVRRSRSSIIGDSVDGAEIFATASAKENLAAVQLAYNDVAMNEYVDPRTTDEPVYEGFDAKVYNLITSYDVDGKTTRSFAFTTVQNYAQSSGMSLQYRVKDAADWTTVAAVPVIENTTDATEDYYKVDLTGLTAGTTYEYRIGKTGSDAADDWGKIYSFTTEAQDVSDFSFLVYGDSQARAYWNFKNNPSVAESQEYKRFADTRVMLDEAFEDVSDPAFLLHLGDIVDSGEKLGWWKMFFKSLGDYGKTVPHFATAGNHDVQHFNEKNDEALPFNYYFNHPNNGGNAARDEAYMSQVTLDGSKALKTNSDEMIYSYDYGDLHVVVLDTGDCNTLSADYEMLHKSQRAWLERDLEANRDAKWTIVVTHRPFYSPSGDSKSFAWLSETVEEYGVDLVLQAHDHIYSRTYPMKNGAVVTKENIDTVAQGTGTVYAMLSATCAWNSELPDANPAKFATISGLERNIPQSVYSVIDVSDNKLTMTTKMINGLVLDSFSILADNSSTVTFYDGDEVVGESTGMIGAAFTMPTLKNLPENVEFTYYSDRECTQQITLPTVFPEQSMAIYVKGDPAVSTPWSFETEAVGTHISAKGTGDIKYQGGRRDITDKYAHTGSHSLRMDNENGDDQANARRNQIVLKDGNGNYARVQAGKNYLLSYWILVPEDAKHDEYRGNLWLAGIGDSTQGVLNTNEVKGYIFDDGANGYVTVPADGKWHQVTRFIDGSRITEDNDGNLLVGLTDMRSSTPSDTWITYLDDIQLVCVDAMVTGGYASQNDRVQYLFDTTVNGTRTHLHTHYPNGGGIYTSVRLGATYTAGSADADTILLGGTEYPLLERGMVVANAADKATLDYDTYRWRTVKKTDFSSCWKTADNGEATDITYTYRLGNISKELMEAQDKFVYRSFYKIALPYSQEGAVDTTVNGVYVYGNVSREFSFLDIYNDCTKNGEDSGVWFDTDGLEFSALTNAQAVLTVPTQHYQYSVGAVGETIRIVDDTSWSYASFDVAYGNTYSVGFTSAWKLDDPYIFMCDENGVIKQLINTEKGDARNEIAFKITDPSVTKVYVRSLTNEAGGITVTQVIDSNSSVDLDQINRLKINVVSPNKYSAWPVLGVTNGKLVCFYTVANQHEATETQVYMKTSSTGGLSWTNGKEVFTDKMKVGGITGLGNDSEGNLLIWYRDGRAGEVGTGYELYRMVGNEITKVCTLPYALNGPHIGNIFSVSGEGLYAFYNTYDTLRTYGVLKSTDDGATWEKIEIGKDLEKSECPVEIDGVYLGDGKILALGRKDSAEGTIAMFQIESSDYGATWTKEYSNVTDAYGSSPNMILDSETGEISLYYYERNSGKLKRREANGSHVWNAPQNWGDPEVILTESATGQDSGNVKVVESDGMHIAAYYAGNATTTGVYGVIINE